MATQLPSGYRPSDEEPFMNERQREYFRRKLTAWKEDILRESRETIQNLQSEPTPNADLADRATTESERQLELRTRDRQRKLIAKIDAALLAVMAHVGGPVLFVSNEVGLGIVPDNAEARALLEEAERIGLKQLSPRDRRAYLKVKVPS